MIDPSDSADPNDTHIPEDDPNKTVKLDETIDVNDHDAAGGNGSNDPEDEDGTIDPEDGVKPVETPVDPFETWEE